MSAKPLARGGARHVRDCIYGRWETLPEAAAAICGHDTLKLEALLKGGLDLDIPVELGECIKLAPLEIAVFRNDAPMIRFLLEHGADITIADKCGERPYTVALQNKNQEMADYLKALEPERWRSEQEKAQALLPYKMPAKMQECLKSGPLRLEYPEQELAKWAELYPLLDAQEMAWKRKKLLSLMARMDNCDDCLLLWNPGDKKLWFLDARHEEFRPLAKWDDFIADPGRYLNGMVSGELVQN